MASSLTATTTSTPVPVAQIDVFAEALKDAVAFFKDA